MRERPHRFYMAHLITQVAQYGIIFNKQGQFLLVRLSKIADPSESWILPGGRLNKGEEPLNGLHREIKEETNLDVEILHPCGIGMWNNRYAVFFICKLKGEQKIKLSEEHQDFKWYSFDEVGGVDFRDKSMKKALEQAQNLYHFLK